MHQIKSEEVEFSELSNLDPVGRVFLWQGGVYRGISPEMANSVRQMFDCGLINALVKAEVFVESRISDLQLSGFDFVVEHQRAQPVSYPHEWSFAMLKAAAVAALRVNEIAISFGYQTKDIHPYNILFFGGQPKFIDLGSLIPVSRRFERHLYAYSEFVRCYQIPLSIWATGDAYTARRLVQRWKNITPFSAYVAYRLGGSELLVNTIGKLFRAHHSLQNGPHILEEATDKGRSKRLIYLLKAAEYLGLPLRASKIDVLKARIKRLKLPASKSVWAEYHGKLYVGEGARLALSPRLERVLEIVDELHPKEIVDVAGNQGVLSQAISQSTGVRRVVCLDYDDAAIDRGFTRTRESLVNSDLHFAVVNPFYPEVNSLELPPTVRYRSEMVIALALTHHLVLGQGYSLSYVLKNLSRYTTNYALIEFMPLGLYDSVTHKSGPAVPAWYTKEWFEREFRRYFDLIRVEDLEINRSLFIGSLRAAS